MRNILLPLFHKPSLAAMQPAMMKNIDTLCSIVDDHAQAGKSVNISHLVEKMALDVVGETSLGTKLGQLQRDPKAHQKGSPDPDASLAHTVMAAINLMTMDKAASASTIIGMVFPILQHSVHSLLNKVPGTKDWLQKKANQELCRRMDDLVERRSREDEDGVRRERFDALTLLLRARRDDKIAREVLKPSYITALTYEQLLAGSETTGVSTCMAIYCVSQSPEVEKKLLQEIDAFGPPDQEPTPEQLDTQFPYLEQVLKETLRLHTTTPLVARQASQSFTLGGYHIPKVSVYRTTAHTKPKRRFLLAYRFHPLTFETFLTLEANLVLSTAFVVPGYLGVDGNQRAAGGSPALPRSTPIPTRALRPQLPRGEKQAPVCLSCFRSRSKDVYWPEVQHAGDETHDHQAVPEVHISTFSADGEPHSYAVRYHIQAQIRRGTRCAPTLPSSQIGSLPVDETVGCPLQRPPHLRLRRCRILLWASLPSLFTIPSPRVHFQSTTTLCSTQKPSKLWYYFGAYLCT